MTAFVCVRSPRALFVIVWLATGIGPHRARCALPVKVEFAALPPRPDPLVLAGYRRECRPCFLASMAKGLLLAGEEALASSCRSGAQTRKSRAFSRSRIAAWVRRELARH
jgi:hypothetical protein